ncbi:hypothetical protein HOC35_03310 [Candidatus Woesearchaeota archaeon]|jgi:hypothetical protein|nr:hypothetical protein [Candidatus Woesearchaeota archaeon]
MELKKHIKQKNYNYYILAVVILLLLFPYVIRYLTQDTLLIPGDKIYNHLSLAEVTQEYSFLHSKIVNDPLILPSRANIITPFHMLINLLGKIIPINAAIMVLSLLLGILSAIIFNAILKRFKFLYFQRFAIMMILVLSPLFLNTFLIPDQTFFIIFLQLLGFYLYTKTTKYKYLSVIPYLVLSFFSIFHTLIAILIIMVYEFKTYKDFRFVSILSVFMMGISLLYNIPIYFIYGFIKIQLPQENLFQYYIADLGSKVGFGIFSLILLVFGIIKTWKDKYTKDYIILYFSLILFIVFSYLFPAYMPYLNFIVMIFAGLGFIHLFEMKWELGIIKKFTIFIIILGLIFSGISYSKRVSSISPTPELLEGLDFIKEKYPDTIILTHQDYGHIIKYYSHSKVLIDSDYDFIEDYDYFINIVDTIFQSRSLKEVTKLLDKYQINHILITKEMKNGLVWYKESQGLLFLLENSERFKIVYHSPYVEIWEYQRINQ